MNQLEAYMRGMPVSPEVEQDPDESNVVQMRPFPEAMSGEDAQWLIRLQMQPGWEILNRLIEAEVNILEAAAIELSLVDPVQNAMQMQSAWTQVKAMQEAYATIRMLIVRACQKDSEPKL